MGARLSRRRLPADPPIALDALPPELLVEVLSHVPPRALVTRCRPVCRAWRDVVDGPTVWLLQLARDRSAEGRALYAVAQRCPPNSEDEEEFPLCALARYCLRAPLGRNLIFNSCGERGCRGQGLAAGAGKKRPKGCVAWGPRRGGVSGRGQGEADRGGAGSKGTWSRLLGNWVGGARGCGPYSEPRWLGETEQKDPGDWARKLCLNCRLGGRG